MIFHASLVPVRSSIIRMVRFRSCITAFSLKKVATTALFPGRSFDASAEFMSPKKKWYSPRS
jgi:hypothetical protein